MQGYSITIMGVIDRFETHYGWFYLACKGCCRRVTPIDGVYKCDPCDIESDVTLMLLVSNFFKISNVSKFHVIDKHILCFKVQATFCC